MEEQQIIQNPSITPGDLNIELSGGYVTAISGHPVGGTGGGGTYYDGDGTYIEVDNNIITLTDEAAEKLNREIPTTVAELTDSADYATKDFADAKYQTKVDMSAYLTTADAANTYQTIEGMNNYVEQQEYNDFKSITNSKFNGKQNKLNFGYDENEAISSIDGHEIAGTGGVTGDYYSASNPSGFINSDQAEAQIIAKKYITSSVSELDNFYSKSQTSGANEIANAIKDFVTEDLLVATSGELKNWVSTNYYDKTETSSKSEISAAIKDFLPKPIGLANDQYYAMTTSGWEIIQGAGDVSGISTVAHDDTLTGNGNNENLGVNTTKIQTKLTDTQIQNITDVTTLKTASSTWDNVSAKLNTTDFNTYTATTAPTTYQPKGDYLSSNALTNYYTKSETSGATELSTEFSKYIQTISTGVGLSGDGKTTSLGIDTTAAINLTNASAKSAVSALSAKDALSSRYAKQLQDASKIIEISAITALQNWASSNSSTWDEVSAKLGTAQYANDSATFVTSSNSTITGTKQYALTTAGWAEVQAGSTFTGVTTDVTLTGTGTDSSHKLGIAWSALSSNKIDSAKSANSAEYITNGVGYSGFNDISAKFDSLTSYVPYSATVLPIGTNNTATNNSIAIGASNTANDLGFAVGQSNTALKRSLAFGVNNYANDISLAIGFQNSASGKNDNNQSAVNIAIGYANSAADHAAALINVCTAENYAFAVGHANSAIDNSVAFCRNTSAKFYSFGFGHLNHVENYSYAFGRDLHYEGQWADGSQYGAFVIGGWNATTSYATTADAPVFIIGNGENGRRSDGFVVYRDGNVSAKQYKAEGYTQNNTYVEASVPKSLPNSGDNAMVVQKMFVCTSDPDIVAHVALANGEGCIFFRVGS